MLRRVRLPSSLSWHQMTCGSERCSVKDCTDLTSWLVQSPNIAYEHKVLSKFSMWCHHYRILQRARGLSFSTPITEEVVEQYNFPKTQRECASEISKEGGTQLSQSDWWWCVTKPEQAMQCNAIIYLYYKRVPCVTWMLHNHYLCRLKLRPP